MERKNRRCERKRKWGKGYKYRGGSPWQHGPSDKSIYCTWTTWDTCVSLTLQGQILSLHVFITDDHFPNKMLMFCSQHILIPEPLNRSIWQQQANRIFIVPSLFSLGRKNTWLGLGKNRYIYLCNFSQGCSL